MTPLTIAIKDGFPLAVVIAPELDKRLGFMAAEVLTKVLECEEIILTFDAHVATHQGADYKEWKKRYPPGSMQKMCEEGACAAGEITDCLTIVAVTKGSKKCELKTLLYSYHGKGSQFQWLPELERGEEGDMKVTGGIPATLTQIMNESTSILDHPLVKVGEEAFMQGHSRERKLFHASRGAFTFLRNEGFLVSEALSQTHPEWIEETETV